MSLKTNNTPDQDEGQEISEEQQTQAKQDALHIKKQTKANDESIKNQNADKKKSSSTKLNIFMKTLQTIRTKTNDFVDRIMKKLQVRFLEDDEDEVDEHGEKSSVSKTQEKKQKNKENTNVSPDRQGSGLKSTDVVKNRKTSNRLKKKSIFSPRALRGKELKSSIKKETGVNETAEDNKLSDGSTHSKQSTYVTGVSTLTQKQSENLDLESNELKPKKSPSNSTAKQEEETHSEETKTFAKNLFAPEIRTHLTKSERTIIEEDNPNVTRKEIKAQKKLERKKKSSQKPIEERDEPMKIEEDVSDDEALTRKEQKEKAKQDKKEKAHKKRIPWWAMILLWIIIGCIALILGAVAGYGFLGDGEPLDALKYETWKHVIDLVKKPS